MSTTETLGGLIRRLRGEAGLRQAEVAARAGVSLSTVTRLEADVDIQPDKLAAIARVVGATPEQLENHGKDAAADFLRAAASRTRSAGNPATPSSALVEAQTMLIDAGWTVTMYRDGAEAVVMELRLPGGSRATATSDRRTGLHPVV